MADNISINTGSTLSVAAESIGGAYLQRVKLAIGVVDTDNGDVSATNPIPITGSTTVINTVSTLVASVGSIVTITGSTTVVSVGSIVSVTGSTTLVNAPSFSSANATATTAGTGILIPSTATNSIYITSLLISNGLTAGTISLGYATGVTAPTTSAIIFPTMYFAANCGTTYPLPINTPVKLPASTNLVFTVTSTGSITVFATYYVAP